MRSTVFVGLEHAVNFSAGFATSILLIRMLTVEEYGLYQLVLSLTSLSIYFLNFGFTRIIFRAVPEQIALDNRRGAAKLHLILTALRICSVTGLGLSAWLLSDGLKRAFNAGPLFDEFILLVLAYVVVANFHDYFSRSWLTSVIRRDLVSVGMMIRRLVLLFWVAMMSLTGTGIEWAIWGLLLSIGVETLVLGWQSISVLRLFFRSTEPAKPLDLRKLLAFGIQAWVWEVLMFCRDPAAMALLISALRGPESVALQHASRLIPDAVRNFSPAKAGLGIFIPKLASRLATDGNSESLFFVFSFMTKLNFLIWGAFIALLALNFDVLFPLLFGERYSDQVAAGVLFALSSLIAILIDPYYMAANAVNEGGILMKSGFVASLTLPIGYVFILESGIEGAAMASAVSGVALLIYFSVSFSAKNYPQLRFPVLLAAMCCLRLVIIPVAFYLFMAAAGTLGIDEGIICRIVVSGLAGAVYFCTFLFRNPFDPEEIKALKDRIPARFLRRIS